MHVSYIIIVELKLEKSYGNSKTEYTRPAFRKFDKVKYLGKEYFIKGRMSSGYTILMDIEGSKIDFSDMPKGWKTPKLSNCKRISARKTWIVDECMVA